MNEPAYPAQTDRVQALLRQIDIERDAILKVGMRVMGDVGANIYPLDFMALGTVKRYLNTEAAFRLMIDTWNMVCARALLRMQIDTALRFSAAWLVDDPQAFASTVLGGERIDRLTDTKGKRLLDAHLVEIHSEEYPWLPAVYKNLSGYVHFSASHISDSVATLDDSTRTIHFQLSDRDTKFPEFSWVELIECFSEATGILAKYLTGWAATKHGSKPAK
jgi:hypothetical protein